VSLPCSHAERGNKIKTVFKKYNITFEEYETMCINKKKYSIEKCTQCGNITINRDTNPLGIEEKCFFNFVYDGGIFNHQLLCEMCLPSEHRWGI
jgi:hypothetical protein